MMPPSARGLVSSTSKSAPRLVTGAPRRAASVQISARATGGRWPQTSGTPGLMMPALCRAMSASAGPSLSTCSISMPVMTLASGVTTLVASKRPPSPASRITTSTSRSANSTKAAAVITSKKLGALSGSAAASPSTCGRSLSKIPASCSAGVSVPWTRKRSVQRSRCGDVKLAVRKPALSSSASSSNAVEPLPLEPAKCTQRSFSCGLPSAASRARTLRCAMPARAM